MALTSRHPERGGSLHRKQMNITQIDRIMAAVERAIGTKSIPASRVNEVVAQALGITVEMVQEARLAFEEQPC